MTAARPNILICGLGTFAQNPRAQRMVRCLTPFGDITAVGRGKFERAGVRYREVPPPKNSLATKLVRGAGRLAQSGRTVLKDHTFERTLHALLSEERFDLIVCHDLKLLPVLLERRARAKLLFDARDYYPRQLEHDRAWRMTSGAAAHLLCQATLARVDALTTVSTGLSAEYQKVYGVKATVLPTYSDYVDLTPSATHPGVLRAIHHGICAENRDILGMIEAVRPLGAKMSLDLMLLKLDSPYGERVRRAARATENVRLIEPVEFSRIIATLHPYDVGIFRTPETTFNLKHSLPTKLFEYVQARLAIVVSPNPDMAQVVREHELGLVSDSNDVSSLQRTLASLSHERVTEFKQNTHRAAHLLSQESNSRALCALLRGLGLNLGPRSPRHPWPNPRELPSDQTPPENEHAHDAR